MAAIVLKSLGVTDIGAVRSTNQDSLLVDNASGLFIVADGMGGHAGGEIASQMAIDAIGNYFADHCDSLASSDPTKICKTIADAINFASARIFEKALENPSLKGMGTTVTLGRCINNSFYCGHVGDSRLYLIRSGFLYQMTHDHSLVSEQVRAGILTEEEAEVHHLKNVITRSVGYQEEEEVDTLHFTLQNKDLILICSDGLHGKVSETEISSTTNAYGCGAAEKLVSRANQNGGDDNITVIVIEVILQDDAKEPG